MNGEKKLSLHLLSTASFRWIHSHFHSVFGRWKWPIAWHQHTTMHEDVKNQYFQKTLICMHPKLFFTHSYQVHPFHRGNHRPHHTAIVWEYIAHCHTWIWSLHRCQMLQKHIHWYYNPTLWGNYHHDMFRNPTAAVNPFRVWFVLFNDTWSQ